MATADESGIGKTRKSPAPPRNKRVGGGVGQPRRIWLRLLAWVLVAGVLALAWYWNPLTGGARAASAVGARMACSCRFVAGRNLSSCRRDFEPGMSLVTLSEDAAARSVTARYMFLVPQTATYRSGEGCLLEPWKD